MRIVLLITGIALLFLEHFILPFSPQVQFILFIAGIVLLGIPHGAADMLVATENASGKKTFSAKRFHLNYIARLAVFALLFWLFPVATNILFIGIAAFHFGETDLIRFSTSSMSGKFFVTSYGILLLFAIILPHFETLKPLCALFKSGKQNELFISLIYDYRYNILLISGIIFFIISIWYMLTNAVKFDELCKFFAEYTTLLFILYHLPMILGFTFYFVLWHSVFSLKNIFRYLSKDGLISPKTIAKQISFYSIISFVGFIIFGGTGFLFLGNNELIAYVFLFLAVLTAPHMQVMHNMYRNIKLLTADKHPN